LRLSIADALGQRIEEMPEAAEIAAGAESRVGEPENLAV
jgi:hypothetical protein